MPFKKDFIREVTREDILKLLEIKMMRITKFDTDKANDILIAIQKKIDEVIYQLDHLVDYTIFWFEGLKTKYGKDFPRRTEIRNFETIVAAKVVEANEKLYVNRDEGFIGTSLRKDEFVCNCSDMDDIIIFFKDGKYKIVKVADKQFVGKNILHLDVFKKNDKRTIYNVIYRDGKVGPIYIKRFAVNGITRDKEYDITQGTAGSKVIYFTSNPNAEAEVVRVTLKPKPRLFKLVFEKDFSEIAIKGRQSMGNILTKNDIQKIALKQKGGSTLGGRQVWFDRDVLRLNYDNRGEYLGEFLSDDLILVVSSKGDYYTSNFDLNNHYEKDILVIEKFDANKVWSVALYDAEQKFYYLKRFQFEASQKIQNYLGENNGSRLMLMTDVDYPRLEVIFGGSDTYREALVIDAEEFISVKSFKAKGKRLSTYEVETINELEPLRFKEVQEQVSSESIDDVDNADEDTVEVPEEVTEDTTETIVNEVPQVEIATEPVSETKTETKKSKDVEKEKVKEQLQQIEVVEDEDQIEAVAPSRPKKPVKSAKNVKIRNVDEDESNDGQLSLF